MRILFARRLGHQARCEPRVLCSQGIFPEVTEVAGRVLPRPGEPDDGRLALGQTVEATHRRYTHAKARGL